MRGMIEPMLDPFDPDSFIVRAQAHILDIEPRIGRTLELPMALNLAQLHEVLQAAFGWTDSHLHQFNIGGLIYGAPEFDEDGLFDSRIFEATEVRMIDLHFPYDPAKILSRSSTNTTSAIIGAICSDSNAFNAKREQNIRAVSPRPAQARPRRGGTSGYTDFLEAWLDPSHDEHKAMHRWVGRKFHPELCNLDDINKAIAKAMRSSKGGYRFRHARPS